MEQPIDSLLPFDFQLDFMLGLIQDDPPRDGAGKKSFGSTRHITYTLSHVTIIILMHHHQLCTTHFPTQYKQ
jgi:hypothetical protein